MVLAIQIGHSVAPEIKGVKFAFDPTALKELRTFGIWNLMIECSRQLIYFSDVLVVGILFSATAIAPFGVVSTVVEYGTRLINHFE